MLGLHECPEEIVIMVKKEKIIMTSLSELAQNNNLGLTV